MIVAINPPSSEGAADPPPSAAPSLPGLFRFVSMESMNQITIEEISAPGCQVCKQFEEFWHSIEKDWPQVLFKKIDVTMPEGQELAQKHMIFASPGIIINGELWATGGFDKNKILEKLKELS